MDTLAVLAKLALPLSVLSTALVYLLLPKRRRQENEQDLLLAHVVITGGSSGIGLSIAKSCLSRSDRGLVTLLARNTEQLQRAKTALQNEQVKTSPNSNDRILLLSADVTDASTLAPLADAHVDDHGPPTILFNVAGTSAASTFLSTDDTTFHHLMDVNYFGTVNATRAFLPHMQRHVRSISAEKRRRCGGGGAIVFTSSAAGQLGVYGYAAYSASKFALRGLAEALAMELAPDDISVTVAYPPDTDTPGYKNEMDAGNKPRECELISETAGLFHPDRVGEAVVTAALRGRDSVYFGIEGWMLATLTAGMSPVNGVFDAMCQVCLMGLLRLVSLFYLMDFRRIVSRCRREREAEQSGKKD